LLVPFPKDHVFINIILFKIDVGRAALINDPFNVLAIHLRISPLYLAEYDVDGDGATGNKVDDDGNGVTGDNNNDDDNGDGRRRQRQQ